MEGQSVSLDMIVNICKTYSAQYLVKSAAWLVHKQILRKKVDLVYLTAALLTGQLCLITGIYGENLWRK